MNHPSADLATRPRLGRHFVNDHDLDVTIQVRMPHGAADQGVVQKTAKVQLREEQLY